MICHPEETTRLPASRLLPFRWGTREADSGESGIWTANTPLEALRVLHNPENLSSFSIHQRHIADMFN